MDFGTFIVIVLRLLVPISILRYPLGGFIAALVLDFLSHPLANMFGFHTDGFGGNYIDYHLIDKPLDIYFMSFALLASRQWQNTLARKTISVIFWFRLAGTVIFMLTGLRAIFFFFPNLFDFFYLYYFIALRRFPSLLPNSFKKLLIIIIILLIPKMAGEYIAHFKELTTIEAINQFTPLNIDAPSDDYWKWLMKHNWDWGSDSLP